MHDYGCYGSRRIGQIIDYELNVELPMRQRTAVNVDQALDAGDALNAADVHDLINPIVFVGLNRPGLYLPCYLD